MRRSPFARRVRDAAMVIALITVALALIGKEPSYGAPATARRPSPAHYTVLHRAVSANGLTAQVDPADGVINQVVKVSWTGFHPSDQLGDWGVILYQCSANPASLADCYTVSPYPSSDGGNGILDGVTGADGTGSAFFEVRNSSKLPELNCSNTVGCSILVWENDGNPPPQNALPKLSVVVPITFGRSSADCPVPTQLDVRAEGEASAANLFYEWIGQLCQGNPALALDYTETSSNNGRASELAGNTDIGVTSLGATNSELATSSTKTAYDYAPLDLNAVVVAYNVADPYTGEQITDITLTPRLIARLVTDSQLLDFFNDPEFQALNPGHQWPTSGASQPMLRAERNADTHLVTDWMIQDPDVRNFIAGKDKYAVPVTPDFRNKSYPVDNFEKAASDDGFNPLTGEGQVALHMFYGVKPADATTTRPSVQGFFGIMDRSTAIQFGLPMAKIVNHAGKPVAPDDAGIAEGYKAMTPLDGVKVPNFASTDPAAYPLTKIDYAMVRQDVTKVNSQGQAVPDPTKLANLKAFLGYAADTGQQHLYVGYVPLPAAEAAQTKTVVSELGASVTPQTTTTTAPTTTTTYGGGTCCSDLGSGNGAGSDPGGTNTTTPAPAVGVGKHRKVTQSVVREIAAEAPAWSPVASETGAGSNGPSPLWLVMLLGLAALTARVVWYTSPKAIARVRARRAAGAEQS